MWAAETFFEILGSSFAIRSTDVANAKAVEHLLDPFVLEKQTGVPSRRRFGLVNANDPDKVIAYRDCRRLGLPTDVAGAVARLVAALNRSAIEDYKGFAVHAGVVAVENGAIAFPVTSGGGKSTLTAACLLAGFDYVSDESLCVEADGTVSPYPKPIALSVRSLDLLGIDPEAISMPATGSEGLATSADLQATTVERPLRLRHVVIPTFGHDESVLEEVAPSQAMAALLSFSFNHYKHGEGAFRLAAKLASELEGAWRLRYGSPLDAVRELRAQLA